MTSLTTIYKTFLGKIEEDEWGDWAEDDVKEDLRVLLDAALPYFKFPKVSLDIDEDAEAFTEDLSNREIQIIATYMKIEWLNRTILTWETIKNFYDERDFSPGNLLDKLNTTFEREKKNAVAFENLYYRSIDNKPFDYTKLAGKG